MPRLIDAISRHALFGLQKLVETNDGYLLGGENLLDALVIFDQNWENISIAQKRLVEYLPLHKLKKENIKQEEFWLMDLCNAFPDAGAYILLLRLTPQNRIEWLRSALVASEILENDLTTQAHAGNLGLSYLSLGEIEIAITYFEEATRVAKEIDDAKHEGIWLGNLGNAYSMLGEHRKAISFHEKHLTSAKKNNDLRGQGHAYANLGVSHAELSDYQLAKEFYQQHLDIAHQIGDKRDESHALFSLGLIFYQEDKLDEAYASFSEALKIAQKIHSEQLEALAMSGQADVLIERKKYKEAIKVLEKALFLVKSFNEIIVEMRLLESLGNAYSSLENYPKALALYQCEFLKAENSDNKSAMCNSLCNQIGVYRALGDISSALAKANMGLALAKKIEQKGSEAFIYWQLGLIEEIRENYQKAKQYMEKCIAYETKVSHPDSEEHQKYCDAYSRRYREKPLSLG